MTELSDRIQSIIDSYDKALIASLMSPDVLVALGELSDASLNVATAKVIFHDQTGADPRILIALHPREGVSPFTALFNHKHLLGGFHNPAPDLASLTVASMNAVPEAPVLIWSEAALRDQARVMVNANCTPGLWEYDHLSQRVPNLPWMLETGHIHNLHEAATELLLDLIPAERGAPKP